MTVAEVTVAYVNPPKGRARSATIKDTVGAYYGIDPGWQSQFSPGSTYKIEYETNGQYRNVTRFKLVSAGAAPTAGASRGHAQDDGLAERIFVCGALNATLSNPNVQPHELAGSALVELVSKYRKVWAGTFGKPSGGPPLGSTETKDDMNDEIPF